MWWEFTVNGQSLVGKRGRHWAKGFRGNVIDEYFRDFSHHNQAKHWGDDVNNMRHNPIGLEDTWGLSGGPISNLLHLFDGRSECRTVPSPC